MHFLSTIIGKTVFAGLRIFRRTGSALPGLVVEKLDRGFLARSLDQLPQGVIVVSGTNGKTTTTKIITKLLEAQGLRVLTNKTGSNFVRGIVSVVVDKSTWTGKLPYDIAVLEQDEAHAVHFVRQVRPRGTVVLNIMRDQMDRFGEIDTTFKMLQQVVSASSSFVVLNANDERVSRLEVSDGVNTIWYGHAENLQKHFLTDDQLYHDESASFYQASDPLVRLDGYDDESLDITVSGEQHHFRTPLQGGHNAINVAAAVATVKATLPDLDAGSLSDGIADVEPAFGRGEVIHLKEGTLTLQLVKNPGGFTHALRMIDVKKYQHIGIAINDDYPDGRDVSWLWDVDFTSLSNYGATMICAGTRAADMANRLKYDEVPCDQTSDTLDGMVARLVEQCAGSGGDAILYCTYTAMLKIRDIYRTYDKGLYEVAV